MLPLRDGVVLIQAPAAPSLLAGAPADLACASAPRALSASLNYILARIRLLGNLGISIHNSRLPSSDKSQGRGQALQVPTGPASFRTSCLATHTAHVSLSRLSGRRGRLCHGSRWWPNREPSPRKFSYFIDIILNRRFVQQQSKRHDTPEVRATGTSSTSSHADTSVVQFCQLHVKGRRAGRRPWVPPAWGLILFQSSVASHRAGSRPLVSFPLGLPCSWAVCTHVCAGGEAVAILTCLSSLSPCPALAEVRASGLILGDG